MSDQLLKQILAELKDMKVEQQATNQRLDRMETEMKEMKDEQQLIKRAVMETNESVKRLETIQEQQHRIIELLSFRSIEQEAALKRIK
ncbi:histidine kinase [Paenibacillus melissococcoides]|uniref:Histidine kinase n=1 Tax=Paenibacillus melissococcoides TaxID=2912268 RepID=A0ABM9G6L1_9BACL|nr:MULTISPECIES: histidine kinase [Paenibacillus]MEB9895085.1 histidine kinase [Bacillus cereus]CAH8247331.1 histidine kinase [Paenibacillus melissococcoides]CAH8717393.1 histidine kinase [Paenibacillus melissococcoides]CAH8718380.1 histidine kinase [Paenibacillus melissococcoides]GIO77869.1 hypothetical protein J6TS7_14790 [Paenibacillus dendritiformis]